MLTQSQKGHSEASQREREKVENQSKELVSVVGSQGVRPRS